MRSREGLTNRRSEPARDRMQIACRQAPTRTCQQALRLSILSLLLVSLLQPVQAHPLAPALLELRQTDATHYDVLWRSSVTRAQGSDVRPQLPADCRAVTPLQTSSEEKQSLVTRWQVTCATKGLVGQTLAVSGLDRSRINVILRIESRGRGVITTLLDASQPRFTVPRLQATPPVFGNYLRLGVGHLAFGLDHVLFVIGLVLLILRPFPVPPPHTGAGRGGGVPLLVWTITAFTLGHSVTLALATLGVVQVNQTLTELGIALSIFYLAHELVRPNPNTLLRRRPWLAACAFGLLHGLGFAGALAEVGLPRGEIPLALLAFNLGIELGQLLLVAALLLSVSMWKRVGVRVLRRRWHRPLPVGDGIGIAAAYLIGSFAAYWCIERSLAWLA